MAYDNRFWIPITSTERAFGLASRSVRAAASGPAFDVGDADLAAEIAEKINAATGREGSARACCIVDGGHQSSDGKKTHLLLMDWAIKEQGFFDILNQVVEENGYKEKVADARAALGAGVAG